MARQAETFEADSKGRDIAAIGGAELSRPKPAQVPSLEAPGNLPRPTAPGKDSVDARETALRGPLPPPGEERHPDLDRGEEDLPRKRRPRRRLLMFAIGLLLMGAAAIVGYLYWDYAQHFQSTDDAFIAARQFAIAPKVSGYITSVPVTDNQHVATGDVIARVDDRDYRVALEQAEAEVASAQASVQNIDAQLDVQQAQINANQAEVAQAEATLVFGQQQAARYQTLAKDGAGTVQDSQQYTSQLHQDESALQTAKANLTLAQRQVEALKAQRNSAVASVAQATAQRDEAQLNLSYTIVTAAQAGHVVSLYAAVGQFAQPGTALTMFVPDQIWVTANFKESQIDQMRPGQPAVLSIDAYPERLIHGHVASVQPGSGTAFSLLPSENATGNYVKIVQRIPVKIIIDNPPADVALGPGMSVLPTVEIDSNPSLYERLEIWLRTRARALPWL